MTDQTAAIEVWARVLCAADAHVHGYPTWQQLPTTPGPSGRSRDDYRKVAAWLLPRMTVADPAEQAPATDRPGLMRAHVALAEQAGRDRAALARVRRLHDQLETGTGLASPDDEITRGAAARKIAAALDGWTPPADSVLPAPADRAAVLTAAERTMLAYALDQAQERIWSEGGFTDEDQAAVTSLRRMADEAQQPVPSPITLATLYRELAEEAAEWGGVITEHELRRKAGIAARADAEPAVEAQQPKEARPCGPAPDQCDAETGEPCADHERQQSHADNDHSLCRRTDCEVLRQS